MPLLRNKHQPYFPDPDAPNNYQCGPEQYCHPVTIGDTVWSQFYQTPCNPNEVADPEFDDITLGSEIIADGDFTSDPAGIWFYGLAWTWDAGNSEMDATAATADVLSQPGLGLLAGSFYRLTFDIVVTTGRVEAILAFGDPNQTTSPTISVTGTYSFDLQYSGAIGSDDLNFNTNGFTGSITNVSLKLISYDYCTTNATWSLNEGAACHIVGQTGILTESVANYIIANNYYKLTFTVSGRTDGTITVATANVNTGAISTNGQFTYWLSPTAAGVVSVSATSAFDGCISDIQLYSLKNDYTAELINSSDVVTDVSDAMSIIRTM